MANTATFRFYEELNDFLPIHRQKTTFGHQFERRASVKDMIESFGVPHTEVELILVNGQSVGFSHIVHDGDRVSVYPMFEALDIRPLLHLREQPLRKPRFIADANVGRLARYLRLLGLDCRYRNDYIDTEIARIAVAENRIVLTRDRRLLRRKAITHGCFVRANDPREQVREVIRRFDLYRDIRPWNRCTECNGVLASVDKSAIEDQLQPLTRRYFDRFLCCPDCGKIYWQGSHVGRAQSMIHEFAAEPITG